MALGPDLRPPGVYPAFAEQEYAGLERAEKLGGARGPYAIQAAIAACHARSFTAEETDWARIASLYAELDAWRPLPSWS